LLNYSINIEDFYLISKLHYDSDLIPHDQIKGKYRMENQAGSHGQQLRLRLQAFYHGVLSLLPQNKLKINMCFINKFECYKFFRWVKTELLDRSYL